MHPMAGLLLTGFVIVGVVVVVGIVRSNVAPDAEIDKGFLCTRCLERIAPESSVKGSFGIELLLWLTALIFGGL